MSEHMSEHMIDTDLVGVAVAFRQGQVGWYNVKGVLWGVQTQSDLQALVVGVTKAMAWKHHGTIRIRASDRADPFVEALCHAYGMTVEDMSELRSPPKQEAPPYYELNLGVLGTLLAEIEEP
jgi:hypothetical protein